MTLLTCNILSSATSLSRRRNGCFVTIIGSSSCDLFASKSIKSIFLNYCVTLCSFFLYYSTQSGLKQIYSSIKKKCNATIQKLKQYIDNYLWMLFFNKMLLAFKCRRPNVNISFSFQMVALPKKYVFFFKILTKKKNRSHSLWNYRKTTEPRVTQ